MAEEGMLNLNGSSDDDIDIPLLEMDDNEEQTREPPKPAPVSPKRRRGRPSKPRDLDADTASIPSPVVSAPAKKVFNIAQQQANMANSDLDELLNRFDWESGAYYLQIHRIQPKAFHGTNCEGFVETVRDRVDESYIQNKHGGGTYEIKIKGPDPKTQAPQAFLGGRRIYINGDPIIDVENVRHYRESKGVVDHESRSGNGSSSASTDMLKLSFDTITSELNKKSSEADKLYHRLLEGASKTKENGSSTDKMVELIKESSEKAIAAERASRRDFEQIMTLISGQRGGIPPELLQSLSEQHRAELNAISEAHKSQVAQERQTHLREIDAVRERFERELSTVRSEMQARIDRERELSKRESDRDRETYERRIEMLLNDAKRERQDLANQHKMERDFLTNQHQMQIENVKSIHESQLSTLRTQQEATVEMQRSSYESRLESLKAELERTRNEMTVLHAKAQDQGDFVTQAKKLRDFSESLKGVFSPEPLALPSGDDDDDEDGAPSGILGGLWKIAQTDFGKNIFATLVQAATGMPAGAQPGMPAGQPMAPQATYGMPGGYAQPSPYAQPQPGYRQHPGAYEEPYEEYDDEEEEEAEGTAQQSGQQASQAQGGAPEQGQSQGLESVPEEVVEQVKLMVQGIEASMEGNEEPEKVAHILSELPNKDQLKELANIPTTELVEQIRQIKPDSSLLSFGGRKYLGNLQEALKSSLNQTS